MRPATAYRSEKKALNSPDPETITNTFLHAEERKVDKFQGENFVLQEAGSVIPIEVKAGKRVVSRSLSVFVKKYNPPYSIRISGKNFGFENGIKSVPFYAAFCI